MRICGNVKKIVELKAMLIELDMDYLENLNRAMDKRDWEKAYKYSKMRDCIEELLKGV